MSFRYTNDLIGTLRHRLLLEAAQRSIARREFTGVYKGIEVQCSGFGVVLSIKQQRPLVTTADSSPTEWASYYYNEEKDGKQRLRLDRVAKSIQTATWLAQQQRRAAKAEAIHRSLRSVAGLGSSSLMGTSNALQSWYEDNPDLLARVMPHLHLTAWCGTPWMQATIYGLSPPEQQGKQRVFSSNRLAEVLQLTDCDPLHIPVGSIHPLHAPALQQLECKMGKLMNTDSAPSEGSSCADVELLESARSRVDVTALRVAQRREMRGDEQNFWERVELIKRAQMGTVNLNGARKRPYKDMISSLKGAEDITDKVQLRFTQ